MRAYSAAAVARAYLVPQMVTNFYLVTITFMHHTHPDVPHFDGAEWNWLRGSLSTIDRSMGSFANRKTHHIVDTHVVHHLFPEMPFYGAAAATPHVREHLGRYYKSVPERPVLGSQYLRYWLDFWECMRTSVTVQPEADNFLWFH